MMKEKRLEGAGWGGAETEERLPLAALAVDMLPATPAVAQTTAAMPIFQRASPIAEWRRLCGDFASGRAPERRPSYLFAHTDDEDEPEGRPISRPASDHAQVSFPLSCGTLGISQLLHQAALGAYWEKWVAAVGPSGLWKQEKRFPSEQGALIVSGPALCPFLPVPAYQEYMMNKSPFIGLSHDCVIAAGKREAFAYYPRMLGTEPALCMPPYRNQGFSPMAGFPDLPEDKDIFLAFLNVPSANMTMEIREIAKAGNQAAAGILSKRNPFYFLDTYGLQGKLEQGHTYLRH